MIALTTNNTFTGNTTITAGVVQVGAPGALGSGTNITLSGASSSSNAALDYTGTNSTTFTQSITVSNGGYGVIENTGGGVLNLGGNISKNGSVLTLSGGEFVVSGVISGSNSGSDLDLGSTTYGGAATVALTDEQHLQRPDEHHRRQLPADHHQQRTADSAGVQCHSGGRHR